MLGDEGIKALANALAKLNHETLRKADLNLRRYIYFIAIH